MAAQSLRSEQYRPSPISHRTVSSRPVVVKKTSAKLAPTGPTPLKTSRILTVLIALVLGFELFALLVTFSQDQQPAEPYAETTDLSSY